MKLKNKTVKSRYSNDTKLNIISRLVIILFHIERFFYNCRCVNYPKERAMFALWHAHQCGVFSCNQLGKTVIMVSNSKDGEIISRAANAMGVETVRGSQNRGGAKASLELIKRMNEANCNGALTIDGPKGPKRIVKKGIIELAKMAKVPVVPAIWWSKDKTFMKFKSWDEFRFPTPGNKLVMKFGDPIEIPQELNEEKTEEIRLKIENALNELYKDVKENFDEYYKTGVKVKI